LYSYSIRVEVSDARFPAVVSPGASLTILNGQPTADAGGPYAIREGEDLQLNATSSNDPDGDGLTYRWDVNGDGDFSDAFGFAPTLTWLQLQALGINDGPGSWTISLLVDDGRFPAVGATASLAVLNAPPIVSIEGPSSRVRGEVQRFLLRAADPSDADQSQAFTYQVDWDGDGTVDEAVAGSSSGVYVEHVWWTAGSRMMRVRAVDKDGGASAESNFVVATSIWRREVDSIDPTKTNLIWSGTNGLDSYGFIPGGFVLIQADGGTFYWTPRFEYVGPVNGKVVVYGYGGDDVILADVFDRPLVMSGGDGNDVLIGGRISDWLDGGAGADIVFGGTLESDGDDTIFGGSGRDFLVGHYGADSIDGGAGLDLIVSGRLFFNNLPAAVFDIQAELLNPFHHESDPVWLAVHLYGAPLAPPGLNGNTLIRKLDNWLPDNSVDQAFGGENGDFLMLDSDDIALEAYPWEDLVERVN
jgi:Ca2+-binding RTX toxin-like protein